MKHQLAFVLGGGGARGALQVGAIRALFEAGIYPQMLVGTSAGGVNATYLALKGVNLGSLDGLVLSWNEASKKDLFPPNYLWLALRALFNRPASHSTNRIKEFILSQGLTPEIRFGDLEKIKLFLVASDLNNGKPMVFGEDLQHSVMEGLLATTAIPPWISPIEKTGKLLIDGGLVSTLPIEAAIANGATEIIAMDISDYRDLPAETHSFGPFLAKLWFTMESRQRELEMALAAAHGVKVRHVNLLWKATIQLWDFKHTEELIGHGYMQMKEEITKWPSEPRRGWLSPWFRGRPSIGR
jgi:NTE family protein